MATGGNSAVHSICPVEVHLQNDKALTESTGSISIRFEYMGNSYDCVSLCSFISRLEFVGGEWRLLTLQAIYNRDSIIPVVPCAPVDFHLPAGSRSSYKCIAWVLTRQGFQIKTNLPGVDDVAASQKLMDDGFRWLHC